MTVPLSTPPLKAPNPTRMSVVSVAPAARLTIVPDAMASPLTPPTLTSNGAEPARAPLLMLNGIVSAMLVRSVGSTIGVGVLMTPTAAPIAPIWLSLPTRFTLNASPA